MRKILTHITALFCLPIISTAQYTAVSDADALAVAKNIEHVINDSGDINYMHHLFDMPSFVSKIKEKSELANNQNFMAGFLKSFNMLTFGDQMLANAKNGSIDLLRQYKKDNRQHILMRAFGDGGMNYMDFTLIRVKDSIKTSDVYSYISGEDMSTTAAGVINMLADENNLAELKTAIPVLRKLTVLKRQKDFAGEKQAIETLDTSIQHIRGIQVFYIDACRHINNTAYKEALEKFAALYPDASNAYLLMIDAYYLNKDYEKALYAVNKLDSLVGGDAYQNFYRGNLYNVMGQKAKSLEMYEKCFAVYPYIKNNMQRLVAAYLAAGQTNRAKAVIEKYKTGPKYNEDDLSSLYAIYPQLKE